MPKNEDPRAAEVAARNAAKEQSVADYYARSEAARPTPSQAENDLAKVGALDVDSKEDDGSEWEADVQRRVMEGHLDGGPYVTRDMSGNEGGEEQPRRGRKPKGE